MAQTKSQVTESEKGRETLESLKFEIDFLRHGGYGRSVRTPWKPTSIFQDSPICLNFNGPRVHPCSDCVLIRFVPPHRRSEIVPCHHIPLNEAGETVTTLSRLDNQERLEEVVENWLGVVVKKLEEELSAQPGKIGTGLKGVVSERKPRILIVDDDERVLVDLEKVLEDAGFDTATAWTGRQGLEALLFKPFDLVLLDDYLPDLSTGEILRQVRRGEDCPSVVLMQWTTADRGLMGRYGPLGVSKVVSKKNPREVLEAVKAHVPIHVPSKS